MPNQNYLLDACAILAYLDEEEGADVVSELLDKAGRKEINLSINAANLIEVYYDRIRIVGSSEADAAILEIYNTFPVTVIETNTSAIVREASYLKAAGKMSFADSILVATAKCTDATIVTCDHVELEPIEKEGQIPFLWIRPKI